MILNAQEPVNDALHALTANFLQHQIQRRKMMQKEYNASHKVVIFEEGNFALMAVPKENRAPTDNLRLVVKIIGIPKPNRHRVQSVYGIIKGLISTSSLNVVAKQLIPDLTRQFLNAPKRIIPLSQAAAEDSNTDRVALSCNCKKKCTKACRCVKNLKKCTQYCHKTELKCGNLPDTVLELTEAHIMPRTDYVGPLKALKRKRTETTALSSKPALKKPIFSRNQPLSATPATIRAKARVGEPHVDAAVEDENQITMSQFEPFKALAHRQAQLAKRRNEQQTQGRDNRSKQLELTCICRRKCLFMQ